MCKPCSDAERNPRSDVYSAHCMSCKARALAAIGGHIESQELGVVTPQYRESLEKLFGNEWKKGAVMVKEWAGKMQQARAAK